MAGTRYLRFIIFAALCLTLVFFLSSSSAPTPGQVTESVEKAADAVRDKFKTPKPINQKPALIPQPGASTPNDLKQEIKEEINKIPQPDIIKPPKLESPKSETTQKPPAALKGPKTKAPLMNATFVSLARNSDIWEISESIRQVEDRFNHKFGYDWVFLNDAPFDDDFKRVTTNLVSGKTKYGLIGEEHWSFPSWIDQDKAAAVRKDMSERKIIYGDSISYRHMCRFESGFFFRQPLMLDYEWYWRVEPSVKLFCDVDYDVFKFMADNKKKYSFVISLFEYVETIPTMWDSVKKYMKEYPQHIAKRNSMDFLSDDGGDTYNHCHFWSNFEIGNLNWLRSKAYLDFFNVLDKDGGFFYERWGDAPVHSIAASLLLDKDEIHFFNDIGYWHVPFTHCPNTDQMRLDKKCHCDPNENFDWNGYSCTSKWYDLHGLDHPERRKRRNLWKYCMVGMAVIVALAVFIVIIAKGVGKKKFAYE